MKVIINNCYGGFGVKEEVITGLGYGKYDTRSDVLRTDERLISMLENGENIGGNCSDLVVATIPDEVTNWWVSEYDGLEDLYYVVDGHREMWYPDDEVWYPEDDEE